MPIDRTYNLTLTEREYDSVALLAQGKEISEIAAEWGVATKTVHRTHERAMNKLGVNKLTHAVAKIVAISWQKEVTELNRKIKGLEDALNEAERAKYR